MLKFWHEIRFITHKGYGEAVEPFWK